MELIFKILKNTSIISELYPYLLASLCHKLYTKEVIFYLVDALKPTAEEVQLIHSMSVGQRNNPIRSDARQWQVILAKYVTEHIQAQDLLFCSYLIKLSHSTNLVNLV